MQYIKKAVEFIKSGKLVVFPTETVYGLGADAASDSACELIYKIKGRPKKNPLILHVANLEQAKNYAIFNADSLKLVEHFWPGPLTIILPLKTNANLSKNVTAGLETVAIRIPSSSIAIDLINKSGVAIAAPSANISNYISATTEQHAIDDFGVNDQIFYIKGSDLSGSYKMHLNSGLESTIIDMSGRGLKILRAGSISREILEETLKSRIYYSKHSEEKKLESSTLKAPGSMQIHYAPKTQLVINALLEDNTQQNKKYLYIGFGPNKAGCIYDFNLSINQNLAEAARNLYATLRNADKMAIENNLPQILIASIPNEGIGVAINERLEKAATKF